MSSEKDADITLAPQSNGSELINTTSGEKEGQLHVIEENVLQARTIGVFGAISLTVNKIIGAGIFSTPATIFKLTGSVGMSLIVWVIGAIIASCGVCVFLEFGGGIPRSGGIKNYLERSYRPKLMQTCIYIFIVSFYVSASNAITFSSYILVAAGVESTAAKSKGVALAGAAFAVGIHTVAPRAGRAIQDVLGVVKLFTLAFIVCTGFAALGGHLRVPKPNNFTNAFEGTTNNGYNMGTAILSVLFSFGGYDNVGAVLSEVKNPVRTLKISLPISMACISVLYLLANIAYNHNEVRRCFETEFKNSTVTVAAVLFRNVYGESAGAKALPALVALSALGHLLGVAFTVPRLIQELAKDGVLPFSNILMENRPFRTPVMALILHLGVTILFIYAPPAGDAFNFVVSLSSYPGSVLNLALAIGLVKLRLNKNENWTSPFKAPWAIIALYLIANSFLVIMPFIRPPNGKGNTSLPYWLSSVVPLGILGLGIVYYLIRFEALPKVFGYKLVTIQQELRDGSSVSRYRRVKVKGETATI